MKTKLNSLVGICIPFLMIFININESYAQVHNQYLFDTEFESIIIDNNGNIEKINFKNNRVATLYKRIDFKFGFSTRNNIISQVEVDFENGFYETVNSSQIYTKTYSNYGPKIINIKVHHINRNDGSEQILNFTETIVIKAQPGNEQFSYNPPDMILEIKTQKPFTPPFQNHYPLGSKYNNIDYGYGSAYIKFSNKKLQYDDQLAQNKNPYLCSPIIFVQGIEFSEESYMDPESGKIIQHGVFGWPQLTLGTSDDSPISGSGGFDQLRLMPSALKSYIESGHDIVLLDLNDGADYIERGAMVLEELINQVNSMKLGCTNPQPNIIIGPSMGGQTARYALREMELTGQCADTKTYISFDSPHKGANISIGLQAAAYFNSLFDDEGSQDGWNALQRPASQQLLFTNFASALRDGQISSINLAWEKNENDPILTVGPKSDELRIQYVNNLEKLGFPQNTYNIAIADGSEIGTNQGFSEGELYFNNRVHVDKSLFHGNVFQLDLAAPSGTPDISSYFYKCSTLGDGTKAVFNENVIFAGLRPYDFNYVFPDNPDAPCYYHGFQIIGNTGLLKADHTPGGKRSGDLKNIYTGLNAKLQKMADDDQDVDYITQFNQDFDKISFIPTMSALDINWPLTNENLNKNIFAQNIITNKITPFDDYFAPNLFHDNGLNLKHVELTQSMIDWLNTKMNIVKQFELSVLPSLTNGNVYNFGLIKDQLNSIDISNGGILKINGCGPTGFNNEGDAIKTNFHVFTTCGAMVNVLNGGELQIGNIGCGHEGVLHINSGSQLKIQNGGKLTIQNTNSSLEIEEGGTLILEDGAVVNITDGNDANDDGDVMIHIKGNVIWNNSIQFSGNGFFKWAATNNLSVITKLKLTGLRKNCRLWQLEPGATVIVGLPNLELSDGKIIYEPNTKIKLTGSASLERLFCRPKASLPFFNNEIGFNALNFKNVSANDCLFKNIEKGFEGLGIASSGINFSNCVFEQCLNGIILNLGADAIISNCDFNMYSNPNNGQAIYFDKVRKVDINSNSSFANYKVNNNAINRPALFLNDIFLATISSSQIHNNWIGILSPPGSKTNLRVSYSEISNNYVGIQMEGGIGIGGPNPSLGYGLIDFTCVGLINNNTGIKGTDILLFIDNGMASKSYFSNRFINQNAGGLAPGKLFDISYVSRTPQSIKARHNFWSPAPPVENVDYRLYGIPLDYFPITPINELVYCNGMGGTPIPGDGFTDNENCIISGNNSNTISLTNNFQTAYNLLEGGNLNGAISSFSLITNYGENSVSSSPQYCKDKMSYSQIFAVPGLNGYSKKSISNNDFMTISPNPFTNFLDVSLNWGKYTIKIIDQFGKIHLEKEVEGNLSLDLYGLLNGMYFIQATDNIHHKVDIKKIIKIAD